MIGGTGTAFYVFFKGRSLNQALVQAVSNVPQAMPLAIVWGGLKFMMSVSGGLESLHRSILSEITSGLSVSILSSRTYKMSSKAYPTIYSGYLHVKRSTPSHLIVLRASKGSLPGHTRQYYSFGIESLKSSGVNVCQFSPCTCWQYLLHQDPLKPYSNHAVGSRIVSK